jgi:hypothetical protein
MVVLFAGDVPVEYRFIHVHPVGDFPSDADVRGQSNGLCVVAEPGALSLTIGLHTGEVPIVVEALEAAPPLEAEWEEVVEVSLFVDTTAYELSTFDASERLTLPNLGSYRVRFNASGMDLTGEIAVRSSGEPVLDQYRLQMWPAGPQPDATVRQTSRMARYWHGVAQTPKPPSVYREAL